MHSFRRCYSCKQKRKKSSGEEPNELIDINPKYPSTQTCWFYNKTQTTEWEEFSDIECEIIEDAFNKRRQKTELDSSVIDLKHLVMKMKEDKSKEYSIKRVENVPKRLRQERFCPIPENPSDVTDHRGFYYGMDRAKRHFAFSWHQENFFDGPELVEHAAAGILLEGEKLGRHKEAQWIANHLLEVKHKSSQEIGKRCIALYTRECFLYKLLNKTLRDDDSHKQETLAPFAYLLGCEALMDLSEMYCYTGMVYRAMNLTLDQLNNYKRGADSKELLHWKSFASTTKNLVKAEFYGSNTLFYITLSCEKNTSAGIDISTYSYIPNEEEVLLSPPFHFQIDSVTYDDEKKRHDIYLKQYVLENRR